MHFGPRPKTKNDWLSSASCQLGRQRDIGAVVNIGKVFSVGCWQLPVIPIYVPPASPSCPSAISPQLSSLSPAADLFWWGPIPLEDEKFCIQARDFSLRFIHSLVGNPPNKAADLCHRCHHCSTKGSPVPVGRHGRHFPSVCSAVPTMEFHGGGAEPARRWGQVAAVALPAAFAKVRGGTCPLSAVCCQLSSGWLHQEPCLKLWLVLHCPLSQLIAKTSEPFPIILVEVNKTSALICRVMTDLWMWLCSYKLNRIFSGISHIMACLLISLPWPEGYGQVYNRGISYYSLQLGLSGTTRLV